MKRYLLFVFLVIITLGLQAQKLTVLHTNDLHSRLLGFAPNSDYSPENTGDDQTIGGFARLATLLKREQDGQPEKTLILDAGDFTMGTLFHTLEPTTGFQLRLMKLMGYETVAIGNHEFDWGIDKLGDIIARSSVNGTIPVMLLSNIRFNPDKPKDDLLANLMDQGVIRKYDVVVKNGIRIGLFSLMGKEAALVAPYVAPAQFTDQIETARKMVRLLKEKEHVDIVICQSHSGVIKDKKGRWTGEDVELAKAVPGIDVIISGHTHTTLFKPIMVGNQIIVQTGSEGHYLGRLDLNYQDGTLSLEDYKLIPVNDDIPGDPLIQRMIEKQEKKIEKAVLAPYDFKMDQPVLETSFNLTFNQEIHPEQSNLGPFVADALFWYAKQIDPAGTDFGLVPGGIIRDNILKGEKGKQLPADLFRVMPLGKGVFEDTPGYSMARVFLTGKEVKTVLDVMLLAPKISSDNFAFWSGIRFKYNPLRMPLDQVYEVAIGDDQKGYQTIRLNNDTTQLYGLITNAYVLEFIGLIHQITKGILKVVPKDIHGQPYTDLKKSLLDRDPRQPGVQEVKEWAGLIAFAAHLPDLNGNGIADVPDYYRKSHSAGTAHGSINPVLYLKGTNGISLIPALLLSGLLTGGLIWIL